MKFCNPHLLIISQIDHKNISMKMPLKKKKAKNEKKSHQKNTVQIN